MVLLTLNDAENVVENNKGLHWDGWDIVYVKQDDYAEFLVDGFYNREDGLWYRKSVYRYEQDGWNIPDSVIR